MELIERNHCVISGNEDLEFLYSFKNFPVLIECVDIKKENDLTVDMRWWISKNTGLIQLNPLIPLDVLYSESHGSGTVGKLWSEHHSMFSQFISDYNVGNVLEIGAGHGDLCRIYRREHKNAKWTIVDPNPKIESSHNVLVIKELFGSNFDLPNGIDTIVHSHLMEHLYEPKKLISDISSKLKVGDMHLFSIPQLEKMLENKYTNCLNFEHTVYLTEEHIDHVMQDCGFDVLEKRYFKDDHSIFYATRKNNNHNRISTVPNLYDKNKTVFNSFIDFHVDLVSELNNKVTLHDAPVFLFGAHIFSQYLISFGLDTRKIVCILDNNTDKQDKRLYGTTLMVNSPKILRETKNPAVILRAGIYNNEIKEDILNNVDPDVEFWE